MTEEPENVVLQSLRQVRGQRIEVQAELVDMRADVRTIRENFATKADVKSEINSLRADIASDLMVQRKELSELEERPKRVEQHRNMPPLRAM